MRRRDLIALVGGTAILLPRLSHAQPTKTHVIGMLDYRSAASAVSGTNLSDRGRAITKGRGSGGEIILPSDYLPFIPQEEPTQMAPYNFDDRGIKWSTLTLPPVGELKHLVFSMLNVDEENHIAHVLFKFAANEKIVLHRQMIHNNTFVVQGEHRLYEPDGKLKEVRPTGLYKSTPPGDVHREGGGPDQDVVVFFDMRGHDGVFYEILDDDQNVVASLGYADFLAAYKAQEAA